MVHFGIEENLQQLVYAWFAEHGYTGLDLEQCLFPLGDSIAGKDHWRHCE